MNISSEWSLCTLLPVETSLLVLAAQPVIETPAVNVFLGGGEVHSPQAIVIPCKEIHSNLMVTYCKTGVNGFSSAVI